MENTILFVIILLAKATGSFTVQVEKVVNVEIIVGIQVLVMTLTFGVQGILESLLVFPRIQKEE